MLHHQNPRRAPPSSRIPHLLPINNNNTLPHIRPLLHIQHRLRRLLQPIPFILTILERPIGQLRYDLFFERGLIFLDESGDDEEAVEGELAPDGGVEFLARDQKVRGLKGEEKLTWVGTSPDSVL